MMMDKGDARGNKMKAVFHCRLAKTAGRAIRRNTGLVPGRGIQFKPATPLKKLDPEVSTQGFNMVT